MRLIIERVQLGGGCLAVCGQLFFGGCQIFGRCSRAIHAGVNIFQTACQLLALFAHGLLLFAERGHIFLLLLAAIALQLFIERVHMPAGGGHLLAGGLKAALKRSHILLLLFAAVSLQRFIKRSGVLAGGGHFLAGSLKAALKCGQILLLLLAAIGLQGFIQLAHALAGAGHLLAGCLEAALKCGHILLLLFAAIALQRFIKRSGALASVGHLLAGILQLIAQILILLNQRLLAGNILKFLPKLLRALGKISCVHTGRLQLLLQTIDVFKALNQCLDFDARLNICARHYQPVKNLLNYRFYCLIFNSRHGVGLIHYGGRCAKLL